MVTKSGGQETFTTVFLCSDLWIHQLVTAQALLSGFARAMPHDTSWSLATIYPHGRKKKRRIHVVKMTGSLD